MSFPLLTDRLSIQPLAADHLNAFTAYRAEPEVARYQSWEHFTLTDAQCLLINVSAKPFATVGHWVQLALVSKDNGELVGDLALCFEDAQQVQLGFTIAPAYQGQGYAREGITALQDHLFKAHEVHRITAITDVLNKPSWGLLQRLGFRREAHFVENTWFKGRWGSEYQYALLAREWQARAE